MEEITPDINLLQGKYVNGNMTYEEMKQFLRCLEADSKADFREDRIQKLKRKIDEYDRRISTHEMDEQRHLEAGLAYKDLTIKWEEAGAYWKPLGNVITKWYYCGACFFTWFSGVDSIEHLNSAKEADIEFERLRKQKQEAV